MRRKKIRKRLCSFFGVCSQQKFVHGRSRMSSMRSFGRLVVRVLVLKLERVMEHPNDLPSVLSNNMLVFRFVIWPTLWRNKDFLQLLGEIGFAHKKLIASFLNAIKLFFDEPSFFLLFPSLGSLTYWTPTSSRARAITNNIAGEKSGAFKIRQSSSAFG